MNFIDAHVHVWTRDEAAYPLAAGFSSEARQPPHFPPEEILRQAKPSGVNRVVLIQMSFYGTDNSYLLDVIEAAPDTFRGVAILDVAQPDLADRMGDLSKRGVRGFRVTPGHTPDQQFLHHPGYETMFRTAAELRQAVCPLIDPRHLPPLASACRRYPDTPVIIDHLCRIGVAADRPHWLIEEADVLALCDMAQFPNVKVKVSAFYALGRKAAPYHDLAPMIGRVYDAFGPDRLMWASDSPYQVVDGHVYGDSLALVQEGLSFLSTGDREKLLRDTAELFFFS